MCHDLLVLLKETRYLLNLTEEGATVVSSSQPAARSVDVGLSSHASLCLTTTGTEKTWLRIDIQTVRSILLIQVSFSGDSEVPINVSVRVGRSLRSNGFDDNAICKTQSSEPLHKAFACPQVTLGQYVYIETKTKTMKICEIQVFYGIKCPTALYSSITNLLFRCSKNR